MGMAASQARLLAITARMHDVEYQAQSIQNAKIQLATKSDQVYNDYLEALDATTLTARISNNERVAVNFKNLCGKNAVEVQGNALYAIYNERGRLVVEDSLLQGYEKYMEDGGIKDPYLFALYMMGLETTEYGFDIDDIAYARNDAIAKSGNDNIDAILKNMITILDKYTDEYSDADLSDPEIIYDLMDTEGIFEDIITYSEEGNYLDEEGNVISISKDRVKEDREKYQKCVDSLDFRIFDKYAAKIFAGCEEGEVEDEDLDLSVNEDFDYDTFNYYVRRFQLMQQAGGAVAISEYDGFNGDASNDGDWLQEMIKTGKMTIDLVAFSTKDGSISKSNSGVSSDTYLDFTTSSLVDKTAVAKAEAEYEHKMKEINTKDKRFDMDLSKLETERTALKTEYESVKKVIQDNIERTFGIFS